MGELKKGMKLICFYIIYCIFVESKFCRNNKYMNYGI